jgi:hypothetical protein
MWLPYPAGPVAGRIKAWVGRTVASARVDCPDLDEALPVDFLQLTEDLPDGCHHRSHGQGEPIQASPGVLVVADVMHPRISDCPALLRAVQLRAVMC